MKCCPPLPCWILAIVICLLLPSQSLFGGEQQSVPPAKPSFETGELSWWKGLYYLELGRGHWERGIAFLEESAASGWGTASNMLGFCYLNGQYGVEQDFYKAREYFESGVKAGDNYAKVSLAEALLNGWGGSRDREHATALAEAALDDAAVFYTGPPPDHFFEQLTDAEREKMDSVQFSVTNRLSNPVDEVRNAARLILGMIAKENGNMGDAAAFFIEASNLGNGGENGISAAALEAANCYAFGWGVERNFKLAVSHLDLFAELEKTSYSERAGFLYQHQLLGQMGMADMLEEAQSNLDQQIIEIMRGYGDAFANPMSSDFDPVESTRWYAVAAERGDPDTLTLLAAMYLEKDYDSFDPTKARECYRKDWESRGAPFSGVNYAICLLQGIGGPVDNAKAESLLVPLSETNFTAHLLLKGQGPVLPLFIYESLKELMEWVDKEDPHAQFCYGYRLEKGIGVGLSTERARKWYARAADQGHASAMVSLARLLIEQEDRISLEEAERIRGLLSEASKLGHIEADLQRANLKLHTELLDDLLNIIALYEAYIEKVPDNPAALNQYARALGYLLSRRYFLNDPEGKSEASSRVISSLEKSAALGSIEGHYRLGQVYYYGYNIIPVDYSKALLHFQNARKWDPDVNFALAQMYSRGEGTAADPDMAAYYYRKYLEEEEGDASGENSRKALDYLIETYLSGAVTVRNPEMFFNWISLKSAHQPWKPYISLGKFYLLEKHYDEALALFNELKIVDIKQTETIKVGNSTFDMTFAKPEEALLRGFAWAGLGKCHAEGLGTGVNPKEAAQCFQKAILYRNPDGFLWAARKFLDTEEHTEGMRMLQLAADRESAAARLELGKRLLERRVNGTSVKQGLFQLRKAAGAGQAEACLLLARATVHGLEGAPSTEEAIRFALQAKNLGKEGTGTLLRELRKIREAEESPGSGGSWERRLG